MSNIRIHTNVSGTNAIKTVGSVIVAAKWKETAKQTSKERAVIVPMECLAAPEVPESFRALVVSVLTSAAENVLKEYVNQNGDAVAEMDESLFERQNLVQSYLSGNDKWMTKEQLEVEFTASATWKRIAGIQEFATNKTYQMAANRFKDAILKLTGKAVQMDADKCDLLLSKIHDDDMSTGFGEFVVARLARLKEKDAGEFDLSAL